MSQIDNQGEVVALLNRLLEAELAGVVRYTNHSCVPNARLRIDHGRVEFYALTRISPGEEITVNYGETHHEGKLACRCRAPGCIGRL